MALEQGSFFPGGEKVIRPRSDYIVHPSGCIEVTEFAMVDRQALEDPYIEEMAASYCVTQNRVKGAETVK